MSEPRTLIVYPGCQHQQRLELIDGTVWSAVDGCNVVEFPEHEDVALSCYTDTEILWTVWANDPPDCTVSVQLSATVPEPPPVDPVPEPGLTLGLLAGVAWLAVLARR